MAIDYTLQNEASKFRQKNGLGASDPINLKSFLIRLEVMVMFKPLSMGFSGMAVKSNEFRCMMINSNHSLGKQNFTTAHELYHLYIQDDFTSEISNAGKFDKSDRHEYSADCFASYLLMPEDGIISLIPQHELAKDKLTLSTVVKIEQYFSCSRQALLFRLKQLGLISSLKYDTFAQNVKKSALLLGYKGDLYEAGNHNLVINNYGARAKNLFDNEIISESHFISLMSDIGVDIINIDADHDQE